MLDLSFGLSIPVRDAALKMIAPGPKTDINKQWYAQVNEEEIAEGRGPLDAYQKTDEKARDLLRRLANSEPYYKKQRREEEEAEASTGPRALPAPESSRNGPSPVPGPIRTKDSKAAKGKLPAKAGRGFPGIAQLPPNAADIEPPPDPNVVSLFVTGVEDDLPQFEIEKFFSQFGKLRSVTCSHRAHCAFINYQTRAAAEAAAAACQGRAKVKGVPLRVKWGKPRPLDTMDHDERIKHAREARHQANVEKRQRALAGPSNAGLLGAPEAERLENLELAPPPGEEPVSYPSMEGN
jgi:pre-mRNA-splicing factor RBM22/SLT11